MGKRNSGSTIAVVPKSKWEVETTDFFHGALAEIRSVLAVLVSSVGGFEDGRAKDEALVLATQHVLDSIRELEQAAYELDNLGLGKLPLALGWARALVEIIDGMFHANSWRINFSDDVLCNYLAAVRRRIHEAENEVTAIHEATFQKAA